MLTNNWTQAQIGDMVGVTQTAVGRWLKGTNGPDASVLPKLADVTHTDPIWLLKLLGYLPENLNTPKSARDYRIELLADDLMAMPEKERNEVLALLEGVTSIAKKKKG